MFFLTLPFFLLHLWTFFKYSADKGDLLRIGYISDNFPEYRSVFKDDFSKDLKVIAIDEISTNREYDILTLGDSFSEQGNFGYQNNLVLDYGLSVVHVNRSFNINQFQALIGLINSDFFEKNSFRYVILEFIEAGTYGLLDQINWEKEFEIREFQIQRAANFRSTSNRFVFPSDRIIKFPYYNLKRWIFPSGQCNEVYGLELNEEFFSVPSKELFFHASNPFQTNNNDSLEIQKLNNLLNKISERLNENGVQLLVMPVPDKLDYYFDHVIDTRGFEPAQFFTILSHLPKNYDCINSYFLLKEKGVGKKDIYFFDDTHWSPIGTKIISEGIFQILQNSK